MTIHQLVLGIHSYLRWILVGVGIVSLVRAISAARTARPWTATDNKLSVALVAATDLQFLLGLALFIALSPLTQTAFTVGMKTAMHEPVLRFFTVEHTFEALLLLIVTHVGRVKVKRQKTDEARHRLNLRTLILWSILLLTMIPWPFLRYGRPLFNGLS